MSGLFRFGLLPARANHKTFANKWKQASSLMPGSRQQIFLLYALREGGVTLRASDRGRSALPTCIRKPQTPKTFLPACLLPSACDYNGLDCYDPLGAESAYFSNFSGYCDPKSPPHKQTLLYPSKNVPQGYLNSPGVPVGERFK